MLAQTFLSDQSHIATGCIPAAGLSVAQPSNDGSIATLVRCARLHIATAARQGASPPMRACFPRAGIVMRRTAQPPCEQGHRTSPRTLLLS